MPEVVFMMPGRIETRTGGYGYNRRMVSGLLARGWAVHVRELDGSFPQPTAAARGHAAHSLAECADESLVLVDGLAFGAMPDEVEREASRLRMVALVHLALAAEVGISPDVALRLERSERRALRSATSIIVTGRSTATTLAGYDVPPEKIAIVEPGTDRPPLALERRGAIRAGNRNTSLHLLTAATLSPRKGHSILFDALSRLTGFGWRLTCAGSLERDPTTVARLRSQLRDLRLEERVSLVGELDEAALGRCYEEADLFVLPTLHESYCMVVAEAVARGLPVVGTRTGAIPDLLGDGNPEDLDVAGLLVPPGDLEALTHALSRVFSDAVLRDWLAAGARQAGTRLPTWEQVLDRMEAALERAGKR